jgi:predicted transcriptional regulator
MKTLSLKLDDLVYREMEELLGMIKKPRNRYINEALQYYNRIQRKKIIEKRLEAESKMVSEESMKVLSEFEKLDDYGSWKI